MLFPQGDNNNYTFAIAGLVAIVSLAAWSFTRHDSREPPLAPVSLLYVSHIIGLSRETYNYYVNLSKKTSSPIFTVNLPGQKMYVVTNADLVQKVQKQYDSIAFPPLAAAFSTSKNPALYCFRPTKRSFAISMLELSVPWSRCPLAPSTIDPNVYGPNASDFVPRRFLPSEKKNRPKDHCFRGFGGGKHLCPGRHFATNEVLAMAAVFIARFDMDPVMGKWEMPTGFNSGSAGQIMEPDHDVEVDLRTRDGFEDVVWELRLKTSDKIFAIVTEDMDEN
ncbi:Ff.00g084650.m01.CDS01 [Fusarium sp. VM40]|nr:Ff.00g084650.m01.CDS01 [Fusarium sp. VM40]